MTLEVVKLGHAEAVMKVTEHSFNAVYTVQGGALFTLADMAFAGAANSYYEKSQAGRLSFSVFFLKNVRFYSDKQFPPRQRFFCCHCSLKFSSACRLNKTRTLLFTTDSDFIRLVASCRSFKPVLANSPQNPYD